MSVGGPGSKMSNSASVAPVSTLGELQAELGIGGKSVKSVDEWLDRLQLPQYKDLFRDNAIQLVDLDQLTSDMLWQIGIKPLGHRLAMVRGAGLMAAQERYARRNYLLTPVFSDYCDTNCFGQSYKITATTLTVTKPSCCSVSFDPVDLSEIRDINYQKGCCSGVVDINTVDTSMPIVTMKLANAECERIANLLIQAKERDESMMGGGGGVAVRHERSVQQ